MLPGFPGAGAAGGTFDSAASSAFRFAVAILEVVGDFVQSNRSVWTPLFRIAHCASAAAVAAAAFAAVVAVVLVADAVVNSVRRIEFLKIVN